MISVVATEEKYTRFASQLRRTLPHAFPRLSHTSTYAEVLLVGPRKLHTNVLSYPGDTFPRPDLHGKFLGEVYLNPDYILRHKEDILHLAIHGILHLLGYLHDTKSGRIRMEKRERALLRKATSIS